MDEKVLFGQRLLELRKNANKNQTDVAKALGISQPAYQNYENGRREAGYSTIVKLADFYGVTTDYLLGREPPTDPFEMLGLDTSSKNVVEEFAGLPDDSRKFILDIVIKLAHAAEGKSGEVSAPDYGPMRHSATYKELKRGSDAEAKKNA